MKRRKVLVLGGGVGAMVATHELTASAALRERFEVTVVQPGHRLGGKGASGRNLDHGGRIEEHGLHLWFGFYDTAFRVMRACYEELGRPDGMPLATLEDAFTPCDGIVLFDRENDGWRSFLMRWPENEGEPGDGHRLPGFWAMAQLGTGFMLDWFRRVDPDADAAEREGDEEDDGIWGRMKDGVGKLSGALRQLAETMSNNLLEAAVELTKAVDDGVVPDLGAVERAEEALVKLLDGFRDATWRAWGDRARSDASYRLFLTCLDVMAATVHGLVEDGIVERDGSFDDINGEELCDWLRRHGARELTLGADPARRAPILRALYDVAFGFREGDVDKADISAGAAVNDLLRLVFTYRGHLAYKMQAGMGDTVFAPFYEVLRERGVRFEFFTAATRLGVDPDADVIAEVDLVAQADLAGERTEYEPLVDVLGLPCWPSAPDWSQLADGDDLRTGGVDFEYALNPLDRQVRTLVRGQDFDDVVLGISVGGLHGIVDELRERSQRFDRALATAVTVRTQAFQLWLGTSAHELGWESGPRTVASCFVEPLDTYCDMTHLLEREGGSEDVRSIAYFCGVLDHRDESHAEATSRVHANAMEFLARDLPGLWPLYEDGHLEGAFDDQYWRANTGGTELYVLSCAGTIEHRLLSGDTGFSNLVAAGDWTRNGIDGGCVEAAAISGVEAAAALIASAHVPPAPSPDLEPPETPDHEPPQMQSPIGRNPGWVNS